MLRCRHANFLDSIHRACYPDKQLKVHCFHFNPLGEDGGSVKCEEAVTISPDTGRLEIKEQMRKIAFSRRLFRAFFREFWHLREYGGGRVYLTYGRN
jgi:hypothetical protein